MKPAFAVFVLVLASVAASGQTGAAKDSLHTIAGDLRIIELKSNCRYQVVLNDKLVLSTNCDDESTRYYATPEPTIHSYFKSLTGTSGFEEVVLLQMQMLGNACDGGDLIFLGLRKNGTYSLSKPIEFCGGRPPVINWSANKITVVLPGGPPNRGTGYIPSETWVYRNGIVSKSRRSPR